jgi:hypothetical protein
MRIEHVLEYQKLTKDLAQSKRFLHRLWISLLATWMLVGIMAIRNLIYAEYETAGVSALLFMGLGFVLVADFFKSRSVMRRQEESVREISQKLREIAQSN